MMALRLALPQSCHRRPRQPRLHRHRSRARPWDPVRRSARLARVASPARAPWGASSGEPDLGGDRRGSIPLRFCDVKGWTRAIARARRGSQEKNGTGTTHGPGLYSSLSMLAFLVGSAVAGGTYLYAKKKRASTGQSVAAGVASGAVTALIVSALWLPLLIGGVVGGAFYVGKKKALKALPPSSRG